MRINASLEVTICGGGAPNASRHHVAVRRDAQRATRVVPSKSGRSEDLIETFFFSSYFDGHRTGNDHGLHVRGDVASAQDISGGSQILQPCVRARADECGIDTATFSDEDHPLFELIEGEGEKQKTHPVFSLPEVLVRVLEIASRGVQIKRFKGLGEMNAKQLFETTMDPEKRQFLRVRLDEDNLVEADKMFDVLMGDIVEPRKRFIEDNALNVRNLDV